jgi:nucleoid-associated protein YgaU
MGISRATIILGTLALLGASFAADAQTERQAAPTKTPKERAGMAAVAAADKAAEKPEAAGATKQKKLSMCLETWDAQTHMTKREWRVACARSVRDYPDAFER